MKPCFRPIAESELDAVYELYLEVFAWLKMKGVRQWLRPLSRDVFADRQRCGALYGHLIEARLAAIATLALKASPDWSEVTGADRRWWIESLAVARRCHGDGIGAKVMQHCEATAKKAGAGEVWLDCVDVGFLPRYYQQLGYLELGRKTITYPSGNSFPMVLMRKNL